MFQAEVRLRQFVKALAVASLVLLAAVQACHSDESSGASVRDEFAKPTLRTFVGQVRNTEARIETLCREPSDDALIRARDAFTETVNSWGGVSVLRFGPLATDHRFERIFFWPDTKGRTIRQVGQMLSEEDGNATVPELLERKSVAAQGLTALEFLLFGSGYEDLVASADSFRCNYALAVTAVVRSIIEQVDKEWLAESDFSLSFTRPTEFPDRYRSSEEVEVEIVKAVVSSLQYMEATQIQPALGQSVTNSRGKRAPFWRSKATFGFIATQLDAAQQLLVEAGFRNQLASERRWVMDSIELEIETAKKLIETIEVAPEAAFADGDARNQIVLAQLALRRTEALVSRYLTQLLGLYIGFNALEGD